MATALSNDRTGVMGRLVEVGVSVGASVLTTAIVVSWTLSAMLSSMNSKLSEHDRRISLAEATSTSSAVQLATLTARQDAEDRNRLELNDRLKSIDTKLDGITDNLMRRR
jgi:hypothetical protein